jgi:hypothetical protein
MRMTLGGISVEVIEDVPEDLITSDVFYLGHRFLQVESVPVINEYLTWKVVNFHATWLDEYPLMDTSKPGQDMEIPQGNRVFRIFKEE